MEYTKGPWKWISDTWNGGYSGIVGEDDAEVLYPDHCNEGDDGAAWFDSLPSDADRWLITAAPEMYEALRAMVETLEGIIEAGDWREDDVLGNAINALAKAEGK